MYNQLYEKIRRVDEIESKLLSIFEGKSWEYVAKALYTVLNEIDIASAQGFQNTVLKLQAKKNLFLSVNECVCHIYGLNDAELLEFYGSMGNDWNAFNEPYGSDKTEVEEEIKKRGLDVRENGEKFPHVDGIGHSIKEFFDHKLAGRDKEYLIAHARSRFGQSKLADVLCKEANKEIKENLTDHARRELELAGMFDEEVEGSEACGSWNILCAEAVLELMEVFAKQGHSGFSASMTQELFSRLSKFEALTELTDNSDEWNDISEMQSGEPGWQNSRNPSCFSEDEGKTYWDISEEYYQREDELDGMVYSGSLSKEEWNNRPMHQSKHI